MKLRMLSDGWRDFTGQFGGFEFEDGVSVGDIPVRIAQRFASAMSFETLEGQNPSPAQRMIDMQHTVLSSTMNSESELTVTEAMAPKRWTLEELEQIASEDGIAGIRVIANPMGLKNNAIGKLIEMILHTYDAPKEKAPLEPFPEAGA